MSYSDTNIQSSNSKLGISLESEQSVYLPYYVRAFLMGAESVLYSIRLGSWCTSSEKEVLKLICQQLSIGALKLLARTERRRKAAFFKVSDLVAKYQKDLGYDCNMWEVIEELRQKKLVYLISPPNYKNSSECICKEDNITLKTPKIDHKFEVTVDNEEKKKVAHLSTIRSFFTERNNLSSSYQLPSFNSPSGIIQKTDATFTDFEDVFDPLLSLYSLSLEDLHSVILPMGGILAEVYKISKKRKLSKSDLILKLLETAKTTKTLSSLSLRTQLLNAITTFTGPLFTIPVSLRRLFQRLEIVMGFPEAVGGSNLIDNAGFLPNIVPYVDQCIRIIQTEKLSNDCFVEASTSTILLSLGRKGLIGCEVQTCKSSGIPLFDSRESLAQYESAIFIRKVIDGWITIKKFDEILALSDAIQHQLEKFVERREAYQLSEDINADNEEARIFSQRYDHPFLKRLTAVWIWSAILWDIVQLHESQSKDYNKAVVLIELILRSNLLTNQRRKLFNRLTINYHYHLHMSQLALEAAINGMREGKSLPNYCLVELARRTIKILRVCVPKSQQARDDVGTKTIKRQRTAKKKTLRKKEKDSGKLNTTDDCIADTINDCDGETSSSLTATRNSEGVQAFSENEKRLCEILPEDIAEMVEILMKLRSINENNIPKRVIFGRQLPTLCNKDLPTGKTRPEMSRALYISANDDIKTVETLALDWYYINERPLDWECSKVPLQEHPTPHESSNIHSQRKGGWVGVHDEGGLLRDIFAILMVDVLLDNSIDDVFVVPTQTAPLDLATEAFYSRRCNVIEQRLKHLSDLSPLALFWECISLCARIYPCGVLNVTWRWLERVCATKQGRQWWSLFRSSFYIESIKLHCSNQNNPHLFKIENPTTIQIDPSRSFTETSSVLTKSFCLPPVRKTKDENSTQSPNSFRIPLAVSTPPRSSLYPCTSTPRSSKASIQMRDDAAISLESTLSSPSNYLPVSSRTSPFLSSTNRTSSFTSPPTGSYRNAPLIAEPLDQIIFISSVTAGIKPKSLVVLLRTLCQCFADYKSGLPDLIMWRSPAHQRLRGNFTPLPQQQSRGSEIYIPMLDVKFIEVKSENDHLSEKQRQWLATMSEAGIDVEVFHIRGNVPNENG